jgi:hypothetical protein
VAQDKAKGRSHFIILEVSTEVGTIVLKCMDKHKYVQVTELLLELVVVSITEGHVILTQFKAGMRSED